MRPSMWTSYFMELTPERMVETFAQRLLALMLDGDEACR